MLTSSTQLQNWSFHVVERSRTSTKCQMMKNARAKRAKVLFFIVKYANLWGFCCRRRRGCLSSLLLLHDKENMWNKTSYYSCFLLLITYYVYRHSFLPLLSLAFFIFHSETLLSLNAQQNVQEKIVIVNISHHLCYFYLYFYNSLRLL